VIVIALTEFNKTDSCSPVKTVGSHERHLPTQAKSRGAQPSLKPNRKTFLKSAAILGAILTGYLLLVSLLPLRTTIKIGADEGFELAKATLCADGYRLYTEIWNDQPPLDTFLITQILKHISASILAPRLMTVFFSLVLLASAFAAAHRIHGLGVAALATALLIASPGFLELSCSVMQEIPGLALALAALAVLLVGGKNNRRIPELLAGALLAMALQIKFIEAVYLPVAGFILFLRTRDPDAQRSSPSNNVVTLLCSRNFVVPCLAFTVSLAATFVLFDLLLKGNFWLQFRQSWAAHFAAPVCLDYGSPEDHAFDWRVLLRNWDTSMLAIAGCILCVRQWRKAPLRLIPVIWLILTLAVVEWHKPWWSYYYIHCAVPLCWCGAAGFFSVYRYVFERRGLALKTVFGALTISAVIWVGSRLYLQVVGIRNSPQLHSSLVLQEIQRLKPFVKFIYTDEPVYSFHSGIPLPPELGVVSLKRFWSGDLSNNRLAEILAASKPGLVLWKNESRPLPFDPLLQVDYRLIYEDSEQRLYARTEVLESARQSNAGE
jgi:hypothetical protein